jgi:hypothetical protein
MYPHKFLTLRTRMVQATSAPRFPRDVKTAFKAACDAVDRASVLHSKCVEALAEAQALDKSTPSQCALALVDQLKAGKVSTVPVDLALEIAAQEDTLRLLTIAVEQSTKAHQLLMDYAVQVFQFKGLRRWVAEERVRVGPSGSVSADVVFVSSQIGHRHHVPSDACRLRHPFPPDETWMIPNLSPVRSELPNLPRWQLDQLGMDWQHQWDIAHLREFRSFWVWCAIALGEVVQSPQGPTVVASWHSRHELIRQAADQFQAPADIAPTVPDLPDLPTVGVGAGVGISQID